MWQILSITDKGPTHYYRFHVRGWNTSNVPAEEFWWSVPDLDDARFVPHVDATQETRATFAYAITQPRRR